MADQSAMFRVLRGVPGSTPGYMETDPELDTEVGRLYAEDYYRETVGLYLHHVSIVPTPKLQKLELHGISQWEFEPSPLDPKSIKSLKTISIGSLNHSGGEDKHIFNATHFPNLESLTLSRWQMGDGMSQLKPFSAGCANLLGPRLTHFKWKFNTDDWEYSKAWNDFGAREEAWVRELGKHAIARKAALKTVEIEFRPQEFERKESDGYPWDRMDRVRDEVMRPNGMDLVYCDPHISKENWLRDVRKRALDQNETQYGDESESDYEYWD
ncbi:hypothetical protein EJ04DRAFT_597134 [Polyplosphaeria fusca]|uniref:Uncharacterized protein n=1 Tax=Polyplosphaeria fusca TaxID=682080 RepID=A0A9P4R415_9PLEO|nr:hypothetical protein EJ04DRAFT_597134 [Polyplosphaeria fusca]